MTRPYSMDLRERVVSAVEDEGQSRRQAAFRFGVGVSTVVKWLRRYRDTGSVAPDRIGGYKPSKIVGAHRDWLIVRCHTRTTSPCAGWWIVSVWKASAWVRWLPVR